MKIRLSIHAQNRARERGIDVDKIKKVISSPSSTKNEFDDRISVKKIIEGREITVVYKKNKNTFIIITTI